MIEGLRRVKPRNEEAGKEMDGLLGYLKENKSNYKYAKKGGYPLSSEGIESPNKAISHIRLKRLGAWWYVEKANHMFALRCSMYNGTF